MHYFTNQLGDREIQQKDVSYLAACFDNVELYVDAFELTPGEQTDVRLKKIDSITTYSYSRLSLIRSPLGPCSLAGIARWLQLRK